MPSGGVGGVHGPMTGAGVGVAVASSVTTVGISVSSGVGREVCVAIGSTTTISVGWGATTVAPCPNVGSGIGFTITSPPLTKRQDENRKTMVIKITGGIDLKRFMIFP